MIWELRVQKGMKVLKEKMVNYLLDLPEKMEIQHPYVLMVETPLLVSLVSKEHPVIQHHLVVQQILDNPVHQQDNVHHVNLDLEVIQHLLVNQPQHQERRVVHDMVIRQKTAIVKKWRFRAVTQ